MSDNETSGEATLDAAPGVDVETTADSLTIRRTYDATPARVYRAFTDPEELAAWYAPGEMTAEVHALDPRPDGSFAVEMRAGDEVHAVEGRFLEVVENERLVHTWTWQQGPFDGTSEVTVEFRAVEGGTEVVLTHERLDGAESVAEHVGGWTGILENLAEYL